MEKFLLNYYASQTLVDLKRLDVSCNYENFYTTNEEDYSLFVNTIFEKLLFRCGCCDSVI